MHVRLRQATRGAVSGDAVGLQLTGQQGLCLPTHDMIEGVNLLDRHEGRARPAADVLQDLASGADSNTPVRGILRRWGPGYAPRRAPRLRMRKLRSGLEALHHGDVTGVTGADLRHRGRVLRPEHAQHEVGLLRSDSPEVSRRATAIPYSPRRRTSWTRWVAPRGWACIPGTVLSKCHYGIWLCARRRCTSRGEPTTLGLPPAPLRATRPC